MTQRFLVWRGLEDWLAETAHVYLDEDRFQAWGTQLADLPHPYRADYALTTGSDWITERFQLVVRDAQGERALDLRREPGGAWTANGRPVLGLDDALDCDLQSSPLTNSMPILRERLRQGGPGVNLVMAWVSLPDLGVRVSHQRYEPIDGRRIRFIDRESDFRADLELDSDGLLQRYPQLAAAV